MATTEEEVERQPLVGPGIDHRRQSEVTKEELIRCFDRLERYLYPFSDGDKDLSDEDAMAYLIESVQSDDTAERLMQGKRDDQALSQDQIVWEVMTDLLLAKFSDKALMKVLSTNDYSYQSKYKLADCLLSRPAQVDFKATDSEGQTALHLAIYEFNESAREDEDNDGDLYHIVDSILFYCETSVNVKDQFGDTPLLTACRVLDTSDHSDTLRMMAPNVRADIYVVNNDGENVLHILAGDRCNRDDEVTVKYFCDIGVLVNAMSSDGCRPLHAAAKSGNVESARCLLEKGAEINACNIAHERTALHFAAKSGRYDVVQLLIEKEADVNKKDLEGSTALHLAAKQGGESVVDLLIEGGAAVNMKDLKGHIPFDIAEEENDSLKVHSLLYEDSSATEKDGKHRMAIDNQLKNRSTLQDDSMASEIREMSHYGFLQMMQKRIYVVVPSSGKAGKARPVLFHFIENFVKSKTVQESTRAMLDQFILSKRRVNCEIFDANSKGNFPKQHNKFNPRTASLLDAIVETNSTELALHLAVKTVVNHKWSFLAFRMLFWLSFVLNLGRTVLFTFALLIAARPDLDNPGCCRDGWDTVRLILEILTCILFVAEPIYKVFEVCIIKWTKTVTSGRTLSRRSCIRKFRRCLTTSCSCKSRSCPRMMKSYVTRWWQPVLAVLLPLITIISFRIATAVRCASTEEGCCAQPDRNSTTGNYSTDISSTVASHVQVQWIFAAVAYLVNAIIMFEFLTAFKTTGVYVRILKQILTSDIWKFIILYLVFVLTFGFFFYFLLRSGVVITSDGQQISDVKLFAPNVSYVPSILLFGVRMFMESGGITKGYFTDDDNIMHNGYQWFLVIIYTTILLFMSVVLLSLLIAQMSNSYSKVQEDAEGTFALARARVVVRLQKRWFFTNVVLSKLGWKKKFYKDYIWIVPEETKPRVEKENTTYPNSPTHAVEPEPADNTARGSCGTDDTEETGV